MERSSLALSYIVAHNIKALSRMRKAAAPFAIDARRVLDYIPIF
jgi:hypothetical protein